MVEVEPAPAGGPPSAGEVLAAAAFLRDHPDQDRVALATLVATLEAALELVQEQCRVREVEHRAAVARAERAEALAASLAGELQALRAVAG